MKKIFVLLLTLFLVFPTLANAEELKIDWIDSIGGNNVENFESFIVTDNDEYIVVGSTKSTDISGLTSSAGGAIIAKYDSDGNLKWKKLFDELNSAVFIDVIITNNNEYVAIGRYSASQYNNNILIVKYNSDGEMVWKNTWGGNESESPSKIIQNKDNELVIIGETKSTNVSGISLKGTNDALMLKYDNDGKLLWQKNFGGNGAYYGTFEHFSDIIELEDGTMLVTGSLGIIDGEINYGQKDAIIIKFDKDGNILSKKTWGGSKDEEYRTIYRMEDGGYLVTASTRSQDLNIPEVNVRNGLAIHLLIKFDSEFNMSWVQQWEAYDGGIKSYEVLEDGSILVSGITYEFDDMAGESMIKIYDSNGEIKASKIVERDGIRVAGVAAHNNKYYVIGNSTSDQIEGIDVYGKQDFMLIKYNEDLSAVWKYTNGGTENENLENAILTKDNKIVAIGTTYSNIGDKIQNKGSADAIIAKYSIEYVLENLATENSNGTTTLEQQGSMGIITTLSNEGYEVNEIIVKDKTGNVLDIEITELENGTYTFPLYEDVAVEVTYKSKIENPKTGILDVITILFIGFIMSLGGFYIVKRYNERLEF